LEAHGLGLAVEQPFPTDGWSGATFSSLEADGRRYVLKRTSAAVDWIAGATEDHELREAWLAAAFGRDPADPTASRFGSMPPTAYLGAARDDDRGGAAILLPDLSTELIAWERAGHDPAIDEATLGRVLRGIARLHAGPWSRILEGEAAPAGVTVPWTPLVPRLTLLTRPAATRYAAAGNQVGERFLAGWDAFDRHAPTAGRDLIERLSADSAPVVVALGRLPSVGLHGDLKLANVALIGEDSITCIDWQMSLRAPVAVELGWFLVSNSGSLPIRPKAVMAAYREALAWDAGRWGYGSDLHDFAGLAGDWASQEDLTWIVGLLLRGWRKGLDAEAGVTLPTGVTAAADLAWWCAAAVAAADRRL
jgi:hypothetical protein